jgi:hypothetical protein
MATLGQVGELVTSELRERVDRLVSAVEDDALDFAEVTRLAEAVGEVADTISEIYGDVEQALIRGLQRDSGSKRDDDSQQERAEEPRVEQRQQDSEQNGSGAEEEATKEELLERAREVNVHGRSSMSKEELAQAVEAEENLTKEELLDRARKAGIEGRSSMTKEELRSALLDAGA